MVYFVHTDPLIWSHEPQKPYVHAVPLKQQTPRGAKRREGSWGDVASARRVSAQRLACTTRRCRA